MPTLSVARGRSEKGHISFETTFGTPPATGYAPFLFYSHGMKMARPLVADPQIGAGAFNGVDASRPIQGLPDAQGPIVVPADLNNVGLWLKLFLGAPVTTGSTDLTHVFTSGSEVLPTATIEFLHRSNQMTQHVGIAGREMTMDLADQAGAQRISMSVIGKKRNPLTTTGTGTPSALGAVSPFLMSESQVLMDGAALGYVTAAKFTYRTGLEVARFCDGDAYASAIARSDEASLDGEFSVRFVSGNTQSLEAIADANDNKSLEFLWSKSASKSLSLQFAQVNLEPSGEPVEGPGWMQGTFRFVASQTAAAAMWVATLKNQTASY
jgi:hypothetical protein